MLTEHFNNLSPAEAERLHLLSEECGEVILAIGKTTRHGYESYHPESITGHPTNQENLEKEIGDIMVAVELMEKAGDISLAAIQEHMEKKRKTLPRYLHHQEAVAEGEYSNPTDGEEVTIPTKHLRWQWHEKRAVNGDLIERYRVLEQLWLPEDDPEGLGDKGEWIAVATDPKTITHQECPC